MNYTVEQLKIILDNHKKWLLNNDEGSRADLYGANLRRADLSGADSDFSILLSISGMKWDIILKNDMVKVGCQEHTYK